MIKRCRDCLLGLCGLALLASCGKSLKLVDSCLAVLPFIWIAWDSHCDTISAGQFMASCWDSITDGTHTYLTRPLGRNIPRKYCYHLDSTSVVVKKFI